MRAAPYRISLASIAGLFAARVCHDHFDRVLVVEREAWLTSEDGCVDQAWTQEHRRATVMQYYSLHGQTNRLYCTCQWLMYSRLPHALIQNT